MNKPLVSAIIPVFNGEKYLAQALKSIVEQDYQPLEIIVIDDGSTDGSSDIAKSFPNVGYFYQNNEGVASARNLGIKKSNGELIAFLDADDYWLPGKLPAQVDYLLKSPSIHLLFTQLQNELESGTSMPSWINPTNEIDYLPSALLTYKKLFNEIGLFNTNLVLGEDTDWLVRAKDKGFKINVLPQIFLHRRIHESNLSHQSKKYRLDAMFKISKSSIERKKQMEQRNQTTTPVNLD